MAKIKQTNEQQDALKFISDRLKDLTKLKAMLDCPDITLTAKAAAEKPITMNIEIGEAKAKALIKSYGQALAADITTKASKFTIELDDSEKEICASFK